MSTVVGSLCVIVEPQQMKGNVHEHVYIHLNLGTEGYVFSCKK